MAAGNMALKFWPNRALFCTDQMTMQKAHQGKGSSVPSHTSKTGQNEEQNEKSNLPKRQPMLDRELPSKFDTKGLPLMCPQSCVPLSHNMQVTTTKKDCQHAQQCH